MHFRFSMVAALIAIGLGGCEQPADVVEGTFAALDAGASGASGAGGMGGIAGVAGTPSSGNPDCSAQLRMAYLRLQGVGNDGDRDGDRCTYPANSVEEMLLMQHIFPLDPPQPNPELYRPDPICNFLDGLRAHWVLRGGSITNFDSTEFVLCPPYCAALDLWLEERKQVELQCSGATP